MARVFLTDNLRRHIDTGNIEVKGKTLQEVFNEAFKERPNLRGYIVDDQGKLRKHVCVFIDGKPLADREALSDAVGSLTEIYIMQALSGG